MEFIKARESDVEKILQIVASAQAFLKGNGVQQWQNNYPSRDVIENDIRLGNGYVAIENGEVVGYFVWFCGVEPDYLQEVIDGDWKTNGEYAVIHRVAVAKKGGGVGSKIFAEAIRFSREAGAPSLRVDTHRNNIPMQTVVKKHGFEYCGIIYVSEGERFAFELKL